jgi:HNH endonuclease
VILAELIERENGVPRDEIMLLRHTNASIVGLRRHGVSVEEYTAVQPINSRYDYHCPGRGRISIVVVIVHDHVYGVYGVASSNPVIGTNYDPNITSLAYRTFEDGCNPRRKERDCALFSLRPLPSQANSMRISGWENRQIVPVQRSCDSFFNEIQVHLAEGQRAGAAFNEALESQVNASRSDSRSSRLRRLASAPIKPARLIVSGVVYQRNADVIAEVLEQANGICHGCKQRAPFSRRSDATPYLEVHHRVPLAEDGDDTVANAIALCPNCHRRFHFGDWADQPR